MARTPFNQHPDAKEENSGGNDPRCQVRQSRNVLERTNNRADATNDPADRAEDPTDEQNLLLGVL
jgi:hypothetical protein